MHRPEPPHPPQLGNAARVRASAATKGIVLVDARTPAFYDGVDTGGGRGAAHKTGHIAGAAIDVFHFPSSNGKRFARKRISGLIANQMYPDTSCHMSIRQNGKGLGDN